MPTNASCVGLFTYKASIWKFVIRRGVLTFWRTLCLAPINKNWLITVLFCINMYMLIFSGGGVTSLNIFHGLCILLCAFCVFYRQPSIRLNCCSIPIGCPIRDGPLKRAW